MEYFSKSPYGGGNCMLMLILCETKEVGAQSGFVIASSRRE